MSKIESLKELVVWEDYRAFIKERFKQLPSGEAPFLLSKAKVDFKVGGAVWKGHAVMFGAKGAATAKLLKGDGLQFHEGKCQVNGDEITVGGLEISEVKAAAETIQKLKAGFCVSGAESKEETPPAPTDGKAPKVPAPPKDVVAAVEARRKELQAELDSIVKLKNSANNKLVETAKKGLDGVKAALDKKKIDGVDKVLDSIEGLLSQAVEGPEPGPDEDPDLPGIGDWKQYRTFMRAQIKRLPKDGGPAFISRQKVTFTIEKKQFVSYAILVGPKGRALVQVLRRAGTQFMEGVARVDGQILRVSGLKMSLLKGAAKTMLKLRAGYKIVPEGSLPPEEDDETAEAATKLDSIGNQDIDKEIKAVAELLVKLAKALEEQGKNVAKLKKAADDKAKEAETAKKAAGKFGASAAAKKAYQIAKAAADKAAFASRQATTDSTRAKNEFREFTESLHRIRGAVDTDTNKKAAIDKLKADVNGRLADMDVVNIDLADPKAGEIIAKQIKDRFGVTFNLYESKITGRDGDGNQVIDDKDKVADPQKEAASLKELYITLSRAPVFPKDTLKNIEVSLRPSDSESEGGLYDPNTLSVEITCERPEESFNYGDELNSKKYFPDGVDKDCQAANNDPVNYFDWATLHEVGHAVDAKHSFMDNNAKGPKYGTWIEYSNDPSPIAQAVADEFGKSLKGPEKQKLKKYALDLMKNQPVADPATKEETKVKEWVTAVRVGKGLWWDGSGSKNRAIGGRVYQEAYDFSGGWWNSYALDARRQGIHGYQFRAPGEWFAELYAAYYCGKLKPSHPFAVDLAKLETP